MKDLPKERTPPGRRTFATVCLDFLEGVAVTSTVDERAKRKVHTLLLSCLATGTVYTRVVYRYSTSAFLLQWNHFIAEQGRPTKVVSDQGNQRISADSTFRTESINWEAVEGRETGQETTWEYAPAGHQ